jgi:titin
MFLGKDGLIEGTQHPKGEEGLEKIQNLEDSLNRPDGSAADSDEGHAPIFTSQVINLNLLKFR